MMSIYGELEKKLGKLKNDERFRDLYPINCRKNGRIYYNGEEYIDFASNDYLGLTYHPGIRSKSIEYINKYGTGSSASRLLSGNSSLHEKLENKLANFLHKESGLVFGSGYLANIGVITAFSDTDTFILSDELAHASIIDGVRLGRAQFATFKHNDMNHLDELLKDRRSDCKNVIIIAESVYSMEGDIAPLRELVEIKNNYECFLYVDEAHGIGVFGNEGEGLVAEKGLSQEVDMIITTFGKALGNYGAFVACNSVVRRFLINKARSFIFSTAPPPSVLGAVEHAIDVLINEPSRRNELKSNYRYFREGLKETGLEVKGSTHIVPVLKGTETNAMKTAGFMLDNKIFVPAIRYPSVPKNKARLRFSITCDHRKEDLDKVIGLLKRHQGAIRE